MSARAIRAGAFVLALVALVVARTGPARAQTSATPARDTKPGAAKLPEVSLVVRASLVAGRPVPYRLVLKNTTRDVIVPILAEATAGVGRARFSRPVAGEITYDAASDRFLENPAQPASGERSLYRSALFPGEALVQDFDVRYAHTGEAHEVVKVRFHRLSRSDFESHVYVGAGGTLPKRFAPLGLLTDPVAREGALLAGFHLRAEAEPETATGTIDVEMPEIPASITAKIVAANLDAGDVLSASWAGGWVAGDGERSVVVTGNDARALSLPGIPFDVVERIDLVSGEVPFCITGAKKEEITPFFPNREIIPHDCLHVSVPRESILRVLEKISAAGFAVSVSDEHLKGALDLVRRKGEPEPAAASTPEKPARGKKAAKKP